MSNEKNYSEVDLTENWFRERIEEAVSWLGPENTIGDFVTVFVENLCDECLGEEVMSTTLSDLDDPVKSQSLLERVMTEDRIGFFKAMTDPMG